MSTAVGVAAPGGSWSIHSFAAANATSGLAGTRWRRWVSRGAAQTALGIGGGILWANTGLALADGLFGVSYSADDLFDAYEAGQDDGTLETLDDVSDFDDFDLGSHVDDLIMRRLVD